MALSLFDDEYGRPDSCLQTGDWSVRIRCHSAALRHAVIQRIATERDYSLGGFDSSDLISIWTCMRWNMSRLVPIPKKWPKRASPSIDVNTFPCGEYRPLVSRSTKHVPKTLQIEE